MATARMTFSARLVDTGGHSRATHAYYEIDAGISVLTLLGHLEGFAADLIGVTAAGVARLSVTIDDFGYVTEPLNDTPIEQTGLFNFNATGPVARRWGLAVPALNNDVLIGNRIDLANVDVAALITDFSGGEFTNDHYQGLTTLADAFISFRKDRKQRQRASFERP
jgi:hypothetical protein